MNKAGGGAIALKLVNAWLMVTIQADGILPRFRHTRRFLSPFEAEEIALPYDQIERQDLRIPIFATLYVAHLEPEGEDLDERDRRILRENLCGEKVLFASRFPAVHYAGDLLLTEGSIRVEGRLTIRGKEVPLSFQGEIAGDPLKIEGRFFWEGSLRTLGIQPFRGPLGMMWLKDWLSVEARVSVEPDPPLEIMPLVLKLKG